MLDDKIQIKGNCPDCGPERWAVITAQHEVKSEHDNEHGIWSQNTFRILQCRGCNFVYFQQIEVFSEDMDSRQDPITGEWHEYPLKKVTYWPALSKRERPGWANPLTLDRIDPDLASLFNDIYVALNNDLRVLAAIGVRTTFDRATELLGVDPELTFGQKLNALQSETRISSHDKDALEVLIDAGSAAAHRGWEPKPSELNDMMQILEAFIHRSFMIHEAAKSLKASVPQRVKRRKEQ